MQPSIPPPPRSYRRLRRLGIHVVYQLVHGGVARALRRQVGLPALPPSVAVRTVTSKSWKIERSTRKKPKANHQPRQEERLRPPHVAVHARRAVVEREGVNEEDDEELACDRCAAELANDVKDLVNGESAEDEIGGERDRRRVGNVMA